ncbi:MAG: 4Fe-4S dicluster domain-containing protein [Nitrospinae bacterium]|nr:4Fe-4S dicluster domain-containing protein [Nitrospinota bacterium]MBL7020894.1 4Fe-4S dicluster domain-containing protein [Nitrospinaceae bacterium]
MKFRHNLAKETFKGKKKTSRKGVEDHIDEDQRGNHSSAIHEPSPLSLDRETITPRVEEEPKEMSRRDIFSFGNFMDFGTAVEEEAEVKKPEKEPPPPHESEESEEIDEVEPVEEIGEGEELEETNPAPKEGFFKRLVSKFKESPEEKRLLRGEELLPQEEPEPVEASAENSAEPTVSHNIFELEEVEDKEYDRRNMLRQGVHFFAKPVVQNVQNKIDSVNKAVDKITKRVPLLRPPGAISEKQFLQACSRCDECIHACPKDAIQRAPKKMGFLVFNTPYIDPMRNPCVMCTDLPCISACPDKALLPVQELTDVNMGYAILDKKKCQAYGETFCQQCVIDCPVPGAISQVDDRPVIDKNICTGCGVCMRSCSTVNIPLAIKIKPQMVVEYQLHKKRHEQELAKIEAEQKAAALAEAAQEEALVSQENEDATEESEH